MFSFTLLSLIKPFRASPSVNQRTCSVSVVGHCQRFRWISVCILYNSNLTVTLLHLSELSLVTLVYKPERV